MCNNYNQLTYSSCLLTIAFSVTHLPFGIRHGFPVLEAKSDHLGSSCQKTQWQEIEIVYWPWVIDHA